MSMPIYLDAAEKYKSLRVMNPHQRCLQVKVKNWNENKQIRPRNHDLSRSQEIKLIWTLDV